MNIKNIGSIDAMPIHEVASSDVANTLLSERGANILNVFMAEPTSLTDAAKKLELKLNTLHYQVKRFCDLGVLHVSGERKQNGKTVKLYSAIAHRFLVPFELTDAETSEVLVKEIAQIALDNFISSVVSSQQGHANQWVIIIGYSKVSDGLTITLAPKQESLEDYESYNQKQKDNPNAPATMFRATDFDLNFEDAKSLQKELQDLVEKYREKSSKGLQRYVMLLGIAPEK